MVRPERTVPLRWRVFTLLAMLACLVVANTGLTLASQNQLTGQEQHKDALHQTALVSEQLLRRLDGQVVEVRGFALTGDQSFLQGYAVQRIEEQTLVNKLRRMVRGDPDLVARLDELEQSILAWRVRVADRIIRITLNGGTARRIEAQVDEPLFDDVRTDSKRVAQTVDANLDQIRATVARSRDRLDHQLVVSALLALLLVVGSTWALRRWITMPVSRLTSQVRRVAAGNLQVPVDGTGPIEFEQLGNDVELMRRRIVADLEETQRAVEALEQNAPLVASLRAQLSATSDTVLPVGLEIVGRLEPAYGVLAGDWYDVLRVDDDRAVLVVVDVCGHGPQAGLRALWLKHLLVPALVMGLEPGEALNWVAGQMGDTGEWFATCVIVEIDAATGRCRYANAGHPPPLLVGSTGIQQLPATGMLFGALAGQHWRTEDASLSEGQMLVVYTDGITETRNAEGDEFGDHRLLACTRSARQADPVALADDIMQTVHAFGPERLTDDATLAVVKIARSHEPVTTRPVSPPLA